MWRYLNLAHVLAFVGLSPTYSPVSLRFRVGVRVEFRVRDGVGVGVGLRVRASVGLETEPLP